MDRRHILILFLLPLFTLNLSAQGISDDISLREEISRYGQARITIAFPGPRKMKDLAQFVSVSSVSGKSVEIVLTPLTIDWFISEQFDFTIIERPDSKSVITAADLKQAMEWESYPSYTQYDSIMRSFANTYPALCLLDTIGTSIYGKLILVLKISDNVTEDEDEPETFYSSSIHGDETGGFILMLRLADYLLKNYSTNSRARNLVDNLELWINPLANPDGTYRTSNTISSPVRANANGYDLNRNFPDPSTSPTRQKETLDMIKFMREHNFVISANFHSGEEVVNYPWDRWSRLHADNDWFYNVSRKYADTVHLHAASGYMDFLENGVTNGYDWYAIYGGRQDFTTYELHGREVTIELHNSYVTPSGQLNLLWQYNWRSLLGYLENALYGIHGKVKNAVTGDPVTAKVFINGHDKDSSHVYSEKLDGSFVRLLAPGSWDLVFTAFGYLETTVNDVVVVDGQETEIIVEMEPILNPVDTIATPVLILYPNPSDEYLRVVLPSRQIGIINVRIITSLGYKVAEYTEQTIEGRPLIINVKGLADGAYILVITNSVTKFSDKSRFVVIRL
jgi:murein tripeptide amidase MpaA